MNIYREREREREKKHNNRSYFVIFSHIDFIAKIFYSSNNETKTLKHSNLNKITILHLYR